MDRSKSKRLPSSVTPSRATSTQQTPGQAAQAELPSETELAQLFDRYLALRETINEMSQTREILAADIKRLIGLGATFDNGDERAEVRHPNGVEYPAEAFAREFGDAALRQVARVPRAQAEALARQGRISPEKLARIAVHVKRSPSLVIVDLHQGEQDKEPHDPQ